MRSLVEWSVNPRLFGTLFSLLGLVGCGSGRFELQLEPKFTSFSARYPEARSPRYPPDAWGSPAPQQVSAYDYMAVFTPHEMRPDHFVVQHVTVTGERHGVCGEALVPFGFKFVEYFQAPAHDVQAVFRVPAEQQYFETRRAIVAHTTLPGSPPPIPPGRQARVLDDSYFKTLSDDDRAQLTPGKLDHASFVRWEHSYQYDGCHGPSRADTGCKRTHCLWHSWQEIEDGKAGPEHEEQFAGSGGAP